MQVQSPYFASSGGQLPNNVSSAFDQSQVANPASMTPTGMNPQALQQLAAIFASAQQASGQSGPQSLPQGASAAPGPQANQGQPGQPPGGVQRQGGPMPQQGGNPVGSNPALQNMMQMLQKMDPATLKGILSRLSISPQGQGGGFAQPGQNGLTAPAPQQ